MASEDRVQYMALTSRVYAPHGKVIEGLIVRDSLDDALRDKKAWDSHYNIQNLARNQWQICLGASMTEELRYLAWHRQLRTGEIISRFIFKYTRNDLTLALDDRDRWDGARRIYLRLDNKVLWELPNA